MSCAIRLNTTWESYKEQMFIELSEPEQLKKCKVQKKLEVY